MIRINLLPIRQMKQRQRLKAELIGFAASVLLILVVLGLVALALAQQVDALNKKVTELEAKKANYQKIEKQIAALQKDKEVVQKKLDTIGKLQADSHLSVRVLDEVASRTPTERLWLISLQQSADKLQLQGIALDNATIAQYMQQLEASDYLQDVDLSSSSQTDVAKQKLKSFTLSAKVAIPGSSLPVGGKKDGP